MYNCDSAKCIQTIGYAKIKTYSGSDIGESTSEFQASETSYCELAANGKCTQYADNADFGTNGYLIGSPETFEITTNGGSVAAAGVACASGKIGLLNDDKKLCLGETSTVITDYEDVESILIGALDSNSIFKSLVSTTNGSTGILIKASTTAIYYNNLETSKYFKINRNHK